MLQATQDTWTTADHQPGRGWQLPFLAILPLPVFRAALCWWTWILSGTADGKDVMLAALHKSNDVPSGLATAAHGNMSTRVWGCCKPKMHTADGKADCTEVSALRNRTLLSIFKRMGSLRRNCYEAGCTSQETAMTVQGSGSFQGQFCQRA